MAVQDVRDNRAQFHAMTEGTYDDWQLIGNELQHFAKQLPDRLVAHLKLLQADHGGFPVDRLEHCLQTATRAYQAGRDDEYVVCALLHDTGDTLGPHNHADVAATIVQPFVSEENHWIIKHHCIFQGYYFFPLPGALSGHARGIPRASDFEKTEEFCRLFDEVAFDPNFRSMPLEAFEPMIQKLFSRPRIDLSDRPGRIAHASI
jgi:predicted HD phosphohydrolase